MISLLIFCPLFFASLISLISGNKNQQHNPAPITNSVGNGFSDTSYSVSQFIIVTILHCHWYAPTFKNPSIYIISQQSHELSLLLILYTPPALTQQSIKRRLSAPSKNEKKCCALPTALFLSIENALRCL